MNNNPNICKNYLSINVNNEQKYERCIRYERAIKNNFPLLGKSRDKFRKIREWPSEGILKGLGPDLRSKCYFFNLWNSLPRHLELIDQISNARSKDTSEIQSLRREIIKKSNKILKVKKNSKFDNNNNIM